MSNLNEKMLELFDDTTPGTISRHKLSLNFLTDYHPSLVDKWIKNNAVCFLLRLITACGMVYGFSILYIEITKLNLGWNMSGLPLFAVGAVFVMAFMFLMIIGIMFSFDRKSTYMAVFAVGLILLFVNFYIGIETVWSALAGGVFPIMLIFFGILMLVRDRGYSGAS